MSALPAPFQRNELAAFLQRHGDTLGRTLSAWQALHCARDGHRPAARWRGMELRCFRCQRCGQETRP